MAKFFINRPIVAMVISIVLILVGLIVMRGLPIAQFPDIVPPVINVTTTYVGASSVDVEQSVATPLEQQVNGVENMIYMKSINVNDGTLTLQVSFDVGSNLDMSNVLTQNRVSQAQASLPAAVKNYGVTVKKSLVFPLLLVTLKSPGGSYDNNFLSNYAAININDRLSRTRGVGDVKLFGGSDYAMRIWVKPDRLAKLGLTVPDLVRAVQDQNVISPAGQIGAPPAPAGTEFTYTVRTTGRLLNEEDFARIVVRTNPDGSQVRFGDIARIELGTLLYNQIGRNNGRPAAVIAVYQLPGSNALDVAATVKQTMNDLSLNFPPDMIHEISLDTTLAVEESITEIVHTLFEAVALVIIVVFIFLQNWRATLIPLLTVPVSLVATFIVFPMLGFSINTLSLLGMVLAIGIVVDDAIVVVEAVMHHIEHGLSPKEATFKATEEAFRGDWFHTGDLAVWHPDGYIEVKDRSKDVIISGGENISSLEVEEILYRHPAVMEAAVVAKPDARWGETPCAFVTLRPDAVAVAADEIIAWCREHLAHFKAPRAVVFGPLPKTSTGKIQKYVLREQAKAVET